MRDYFSEKEILPAQLDRVRRAYDLTVEQFRQGIDPYAGVPPYIRDSTFFKSLSQPAESEGSDRPEIRRFLSPQPGMTFLDAGCCANLFNYRLDRWPSVYHGLDLSSALIKAMQSFVNREKIPIGGLWVGEIAALPFKDHCFDLAAAIGVLEYGTWTYLLAAVDELHRVLKNRGRLVVDIPNCAHSQVQAMAELESFLQRPIFLHPRAEFEQALRSRFSIQAIEASGVMLRYYLQTL